MAKIKLQDHVSQDKTTKLWGFQCPVTNGSCGAPNEQGKWTGFSSIGWPEKEHALARFEQHADEHKGLAKSLQPMDEFMEDKGIKELMSAPQDKKIITPKDFA